MSSSHAIKVHFEPEPKFYLPGDVISGTLNLHVFKDIEVKDIQVKLQGHARTRVTLYTYNHKNERRRDTRNESHEVLYDVMTVFPPPNVRDATRSKPSFSLTKGEYVYPFSLRFPITAHCGDPESKQTANLYRSRFETGKHEKLFSGSNYEYLVQHARYPIPPSVPETSIGDCEFEVRYSLKVSLHRANFFSIDTRMERVLRVLPSGPSPVQAVALEQARYFFSNNVQLNIPNPTEDKKHWYSGAPSNSVDFTFGVSTSQSLIPGTQPLSLHILSRKDGQSYTYDSKQGKISMGVIYLVSLEIGLVNTVQMTAGGNRSSIQYFTKLFSHTRKPIKIDLANLKQNKLPNSQFENGIDLSRILGGWTIPDHIIPSFAICNIDYRTSLFVRANFSGSPQGGSLAKCKLNHPVMVLGPIIDTTEETAANLEDLPPPHPEAVPTYGASLGGLPSMESDPKQTEELPTYQEATASSFR